MLLMQRVPYATLRAGNPVFAAQLQALSVSVEEKNIACDTAETT